MGLQVAVGLETAEFFEIATETEVGLVAIAKPGGTGLDGGSHRRTARLGAKRRVTFETPGGTDDFGGEVAFEGTVGLEFGLPEVNVRGVWRSVFGSYIMSGVIEEGSHVLFSFRGACFGAAFDACLGDEGVAVSATGGGLPRRSASRRRRAVQNSRE